MLVRLCGVKVCVYKYKYIALLSVMNSQIKGKLGVIRRFLLGSAMFS